MPTGYTCHIEDGKIDNGDDFLKLCARAFGACIEMRDEPLSSPLPEEFKPDTYHKEQLEKAKINFDKYSKMTINDAQKIVDVEYEKNIAECKKYIKKNQDIHDRYIKVLNEVKNWTPPTTDHNELKEFAIKQITMCLPDLNSSWSVRKLNTPKQSASEWLENKIQSCKDDIEYHTKEWNEEVKRTNDRNKWIKDLRESFNK